MQRIASLFRPMLSILCRTPHLVVVLVLDFNGVMGLRNVDSGFVVPKGLMMVASPESFGGWNATNRGTVPEGTV
jgi:hypothetical protein